MLCLTVFSLKYSAMLNREYWVEAWSLTVIIDNRKAVNKWFWYRIVSWSCHFLSPLSNSVLLQWSLRLDPSDRPTCTQLLRHELFQRNGWADKYTTELRTKIQQEFEENPLLKSLGITVSGSVNESQQTKPKEIEK